MLNDTSLPLISVITVTYNAEKYLEKTILSVIQQTYPHIEYIIMDGKSTDKTLEIADKYQKNIKKIISEPDKGIYDAMNKGIALAQGDYIWFMNAGDEIYSAETLENIFTKLPLSDVYYGETAFYDLQGKYLGIRSEATPLKLPPKLHWKHLGMGLMVCHQAIIVKKEIVPKYDLAHPYSADIDWVIRCLKQAQSITHTHQIIAKYLQGGFSRKHLVRSLQDRFKILVKHYGWLMAVWNHFRIVLRSLAYILRNRKGY
jgi:glycosyltransferase involved in cell wall biosynthesis